MLDVFTKEAPIRLKFTYLKALSAILWIPACVVAGLAAAGLVSSLWTLLACAVSLAFNLVALHIAAERICTPYVNTVLRMEALAAGDVASPIDYTDHKDCVGRMTRAMATFRANIEQMTGLETQQQIISTLSANLKRLSNNDLSAEITAPFPGAYEEIRSDFNTALRALAATVAEVRSGAHGVMSGASEIRTATNDLSQRNERQAASLEETAAAMDQATANVRQIAGQSSEAAKAVQETLVVANGGSQVVGQAVKAIETIKGSSDEIESIVTVIDGIAFQTNLLALNAGVEAARAGDAGKGFAVVANEVRALAQRAADAAQEIKGLIGASSANVEAGVGLAKQAGEVIASLLQRMEEMSTFVSRVSLSATEQAQSLEQVNIAIKEMDRMTQQNAAMVEESTAAANSLATEAQAVGNLVDVFVLGTEVKRAKRLTSPEKAPVRLVSNGPARVSAPDEWSEF